MYNNIFDSHAHYDDERFENDFKEVLSSFKEGGICGVINCGSDIDSSKKSIELAERYDFIYAAVGVHAHEASNAPKDFLNKIKELANHNKVVAIGEIGLDYHYDFSPRELQIEVLEAQLILANELDLPVIIHDRESHEDIMNLLKKHKPKGVVHCFSGSSEMAKEIVRLDMYIGIGGAVTFKNAKKPVEVVREIPLDKLLIETDAPYMTPVPYRGERNTSLLVPITAEKIAEIRNITTQEILDITAKNARDLFRV